MFTSSDFSPEHNWKSYRRLKNDLFWRAAAEVGPIPGAFEFIECVHGAGICDGRGDLRESHSIHPGRYGFADAFQRSGYRRRAPPSMLIPPRGAIVDPDAESVNFHCVTNQVIYQAEPLVFKRSALTLNQCPRPMAKAVSGGPFRVPVSKGSSCSCSTHSVNFQLLVVVEGRITPCLLRRGSNV